MHTARQPQDAKRVGVPVKVTKPYVFRYIVAYTHLGSSTSARLSSTSTPKTSSTLQTSTRTVSSSTPSSTQRVTTNARCGKEGNGQTCLGSSWGSCCSQYSYVRCDCEVSRPLTYCDSVEATPTTVELAVSKDSANVMLLRRH